MQLKLDFVFYVKESFSFLFAGCFHFVGRLLVVSADLISRNPDFEVEKRCHMVIWVLSIQKFLTLLKRDLGTKLILRFSFWSNLSLKMVIVLFKEITFQHSYIIV